MYDVVSIGDCTQDIFLFLGPEEAHLHDIRHERQLLCLNYSAKLPVQKKYDCLGGNAANVAVAFGRLGLKTAIYSHLGDDFTGERLEKDLKKNEVDIRYLVKDEGVASNYNTVLSVNGERTILVYHLKRRYHLPALEAAKWIYLTSMGEDFEQIIPDLLTYLQLHKAKLCYQPGTFQLRFGAEKLKELLKQTTIISMNREEAEHFLGKATATPIRELVEGLHALGPEITLVTDGGEGAYLLADDQLLHLPIIEGIDKVDSTGAGDSFSAGVVAAIMKGLPLREALRWGQAEAGGVIQEVGAQTGLMYHKQLLHFLERYPNLQAEIIT